MAQITTLTDTKTGKTVYPLTSTKAVFNEKGESIEDIMPDRKAWLIDAWNAAAGIYGTYNGETGFFELNGLTDITYEEAISIYALYSATQTKSTTLAGKFMNCKIRTLFPLLFYTNNMGSAIHMFNGCAFLQAIQITDKPENKGATNYDGMFSSCANLKTVYGELNLGNVTTDLLHSMFSFCKKLEEIRLVNIKVNIYLQWSPLISLESLTYMVKNAKNTQPIIIRLHSAAYDRITEELFALAAENNITFVTA